MRLECLFCGSRHIGNSFFPPTTFNGKVFTYKKCGDCGLHFLEQELSPEDLKLLYSPQYHDEGYCNRSQLYLKTFESIRKFGKNLEVLDYGCGTGDFIRFIHGKVKRGAGVEFDASFVNRLKDQVPGVEFFSAEQFWKDPTQRFDVIRVGDVLEHTCAPQDFIASLKSRLKPQGLLWVEGPLEVNRSVAFLARRLHFLIAWNRRRQRVAQHPPYHVFFANAANQKAFLERQGLRTVEFSIYENAWPFIERLSDVKRPGDVAKFALARASMAWSKCVPGFGNRFVYIGQPTE